MNLTALGANIAQQSGEERKAKALNLLSLDNPIPAMNKYVKGVCYDVVAFTRYLLGAQITPNQLTELDAQAWAPIFMQGTRPWSGTVLQVGTAMMFCDDKNNNPFHVAIITGNLGCMTTVVRSENGNTLGAGWVGAGDCDLANLNYIEGNTYEDPKDERKFNVWISSL